MPVTTSSLLPVTGAIRQAQAQSAPGADRRREPTRRQPYRRTRSTPGCRWHRHERSTYASLAPSQDTLIRVDQPTFGQIPRHAATGNRAAGLFATPGGPPLWSHPLQPHGSSQSAPPARQPFVASERSLPASERSNSAQEVEDLLGSQGRSQRYQGGWAHTSQAQQQRSKQCILSFY
jgi:hypothetical protein